VDFTVADVVGNRLLAFLLRIWEVPGLNSARRPVILIGISVVILRSLQASVCMALQIKSQLFPSFSFPIHYALIILSFDVVQSNLLTVE
jgi:hypothetical protein